MKVNSKIHWWKPEVGSKELKYLKKVIQINYTNEGYYVEKFEKKIKKK